MRASRPATKPETDPTLFPATNWGDVKEAGDQEHSERRCAALARLWPRYQRGLRTYLQHRFHLGPHEIDEALQSFVVDKILLGNLLAEVDQRRGHFRTFLLCALENHFRSTVRRAEAEKRAPQGGFVSVEELPPSQHPDGVPAPSREMDQAWALAVLSEAAGRMERECRAGDRTDIWIVFSGRGLEPILRGEMPVPYEALAEQCGFDDPQSARLLLHSGKRMFRRAVETVIAEYVRSTGQIEEELESLVAILFAS